MAIVIKTLSDSAQARKDLSDLKQSVEGIKKTSEGLADRFVSIGKGLAFGVAATTAATAFFRLSDSITNLNNKINSITNSAGAAKKALQDISSVAASTRTNLDATVSLYTKMSMASKDLGASQSQIVSVISSVNKGFKISGATAEESRAAITQLSQAFASGKLAGDEFNSVLENAPFLAREITKGMGITLGQLYKLRDEGKLLAKDVFGAILKQTGAINNQFQKVQVTYADAFTNLGTAFKLLTMSVFDSFSSSSGGFATMLNNWAVGIIQFAQNFSFYLLKAQTTAITFVVDVTEFFHDMWIAITEGGPDAVVEMFNSLVTNAWDMVKTLAPIAKEIANVFVQYTQAFYAGASASFFSFIAWLKKSERTEDIAKVLLRINGVIFEQAKALGEMLSKIDFSAIMAKAKATVVAIWEEIAHFNFKAIWDRLVSAFKSGYDNLSKIDVTKFFPSLETALAYVKGWAEKAAHWFWWLYDVVIGHSYIPDLVIGVISWMGKLLGLPITIMKKFVSLVGGAFKSINPFSSWKKALVGFTAAAAAMFALFRGNKSPFSGIGDSLNRMFGAVTLTDAKGNPLPIPTMPKPGGQTSRSLFSSAKMYDAQGKELPIPGMPSPASGPGMFTSVMKKIDTFFNGRFQTTEQNPVSGKVETKEYARRSRFFDKLHIPRDQQAQIAFALTGIVTSALYLTMGSGRVKDVVISLFTSAALIGIARGIDEKVLHKFFADGAATFIGFVDKGFKTILGTSISNDPFGFLLLIAKTSLLFKAGREYFLDLAKSIVTAPTTVGIGTGNLVGLGLLNTQIALAEKKFTSNMAKFNASIALEGRNVGQAIHNLATQLNISTEEAARMVRKNMTNGKLQPGPLKDAVDATRRQEALTSQRDLYASSQSGKNDAAKERVKKIKEDFAEAGQKLRDGVTSFGGGVGGIMGAGAGLEYSQNKLKEMQDARTAQAVTALQSGQVTMGGQRLTADQAGKVASGEIAIKDLDQAGQKIAENILKGMEVPAFQKLFVDAAGIMGGQLIGSMLGAMAAQIATWTVMQLGSMLIVEKARAVYQKVAQLVGMALFRVQYFAVIVGGAALQKAGAVAGAIAAGAVTMTRTVAAFAMGGLVAAVEFVAGLVGWPALVAAALIAAVVGAAYLIYKNWDKIKEVGKEFVALLVQAWLHPIDFLTKTLPRIISSLFDKVRSWLPTWLGGSNDSQPPEAPVKKASGGYISGPGTKTSDSIPALLSNGEFVINAEATSRNRRLLEAINSGTVHRYAGGGPVSTLGSKRAEAVAERDKAQSAASKASVGWQRAAASELVAKWDNYISTIDEAMSIIDMPGETSSPTGGGKESGSRKSRGEGSKQGAGLKFADELDAINTIFPELNINMDSYLKMTDEARKKLLDLVLPIKRMKDLADDLPAGSPEAFALAQKAAENAASGAEAAFNIAAEGRPPYTLRSKRMESVGLDISSADFNLLTPDTIKSIDAYLAEQQVWAKELASGTTPERAREIQLKMNDATAAINRLLASTKVLNSVSKFDDVEFAGLDVTKDSFDRLTNAAQDQLRAIADEIIQLQEVVAKSANDEAARLAALTRIDALKKEAGKLTARPEDRAKKAGEDFAVTMKDSFTSGIAKFLKTGKFPLLDLANTFVDKLIGNFADTLSNLLFGKGTKLDSIFNSIGQSSVGGAGGILGGIIGGTRSSSPTFGGGPNPDGTMSAVGGSAASLIGGLGKKSVSKVGNTIAGTLVKEGPAVGEKITGALAEKAGDIGTDIGDSIGKATAGRGGGMGGMAGLAGAAGSLFGLLIGNLFSEGGPVHGPGTSTSDSIPARLSNGEYVIKAKQVAKHRSLISAINNDQVAKFADGGLVGEVIPTTSAVSSNMKPVGIDARQNNTTNNFQVTGDISRQTRREVLNLIPQIAMGVNGYNREKGNR